MSPENDLEQEFDAAWELFEKGDIPGARRLAESLRKRDPELADGAFLMACCARATGEEELALSELKEAAKLDPDWAEPEMSAADLLAARGDLEEALPHALAAVAKAEEEVEFLDAIALKASLELDLDREAAARKTLAVLPGPKTVDPSAESACELGHLFLAIDEVDTARGWFQRAAEIAPEDPDVFHGLGLAAELAGNEAEKREAWLRTLDLDDAADAREPARMTETQVAEIAEAALEELPPRARQLLAEVPILIADRPARADVETGLDPRLMGLFSGAALPEGTSVGGGPRLSQIVLFRRNLERAAPEDDDLRDEIRTTLLHETGHFFGMTEEDLDQVGLG
jgi:predicted Zn-dependent protease with MMP-like domain/Flp pilus assembly protein TadD